VIGVVGSIQTSIKDMTPSDLFTQQRAHVRTLSDEALSDWTAGWNLGSETRAIGEMEMRRRAEEKQKQRDRETSRRTWIVLAISSLVAIGLWVLTRIFR
jgi:hypothetical protein